LNVEKYFAIEAAKRKSPGTNQHTRSGSNLTQTSIDTTNATTEPAEQSKTPANARSAEQAAQSLNASATYVKAASFDAHGFSFFELNKLIRGNETSR
jgi:hypothetical protein